jgi:monofunctional biosynthetic peptidoglycan transglycosylase
MAPNEHQPVPSSDHGPGNPPAPNNRAPEKAQISHVQKSLKKNPFRGKKPMPWRKWIRFLLIGLGALSVLGCGMVLWVWWLIHDLPDDETIRRYRPHLSTEIRDIDNALLLSLGKHRDRLWCNLHTISPWLIKAVITAEDDTFMQHSGIRMEQIRKAFQKNLKQGRYAMGGSTITQQLARNAFLTRKKTLMRKIREVFLARRMERTLSKRHILELYLNVVEWGEDIYGSHTAALFYFGKSVELLNLSESALLAGMLPNPRYFNPFNCMHKVKKKQRHVLQLMRNNGIISKEEMEAAIEAPILLRKESDQSYFGRHQKRGSCFNTLLTEYLEKHIDSNLLYRGDTIFLTLKRDLQKLLEQHGGMGSDELILVAREDESIRAFTCIGGTAWESDEIPHPSAESGPAPEEMFMKENDTLSEKINTEEDGEMTHDSSSLVSGDNALSPDADETPEQASSAQQFPCTLQKMTKNKFMQESLIR